MARKKSATLTDAELRLMEILWRQGESSVSDVVTALPADLNLAYNTVLTTLRILERKGFVTHVKSGRAHLYRPLVDRTEARRTAVAYMLRRFFDNSPEALALHIL
ncbi:MAG TPA: BlaI/MecI/CopY family transcriptional regulator, partial [candidate division Zixibacteria bacterium]|nr:BlaI/MecI/CopY family transcriptional regulator [candidate division Zixibacteria bacterium]